VPSGPEPSFGAPTPAPSAPRASGGLFSLEPYKVYFDLDTADVLHRMRLACLPLGSNFTTAVQDNPDLCAHSDAPKHCVHNACLAQRVPTHATDVQLRPVLDSGHARLFVFRDRKPRLLLRLPRNGRLDI